MSGMPAPRIMKNSGIHRAATVLLAIILASCSPSTDSSMSEEGAKSDLAETLVGRWRAVLQSPGGELPFGLEIEWDDDSTALTAAVVNGEERAPFSGVTLDGETVTLAFDWYDAKITATYYASEETLRGEWRKTIPDGESHLPFSANRGEQARFRSNSAPDAPAVDSELSDISGVWEVEFSDEDGSEPARGEFVQQGTDVHGTFLTPTGDYRYLAGSYEDGELRLSTFDGAHAFLFSARADTDGTLSGDFWSRDVYHATWTARRSQTEEEASITADWQTVGLTNDEGAFRFEFPNLDGEIVSLSDDRFAGKVVVVNIFGSWCPNCNDEAPLLAEWDRRWQSEGLEIVGLAYEFSGDPERDAVVVRRYAERHGIEFPILLAGTSDKAEASETLPDLTAVLAFPTTVIIGRDGTVRRIHSGFSGPGTGVHYDKLRESLEGTLNELLLEG